LISVKAILKGRKNPIAVIPSSDTNIMYKPAFQSYIFLCCIYAALHNISVSGHSDIKWGMIHIGITHLNDVEFVYKPLPKSLKVVFSKGIVY
jgi:hypothetical protein